MMVFKGYRFPQMGINIFLARLKIVFLWSAGSTPDTGITNSEGLLLQKASHLIV
ncbi:hypothetical protein [Peribacillus sp. AS_2]|uniref:hypothetical protein n=1 Tax=Peribacillus sp. AS_2 TaxID=2996755 RepID=UPI0022A7E516|nr:hypothetical protein [Peribacillus sp. AS_2]MCZ0871662.1 hypothetical protein [Peribacillus sp. AS_2]